MTVSFIYNRSTRTLPCHSSMQHTPIPDSKPEKGENYFKQQSPVIGPDDNNDNNVEIEFVSVHNTTKMWEGHRYPAYSSKAARLESYTGVMSDPG